ncbi:MAG: NAD(P)H-dependent oxidoreductase subunit E [Spirochaetaceae bacterium]|nr:NAD(P)H-dependent oxidoreductase subunit E [Spirochaetaceae bacterium]
MDLHLAAAPPTGAERAAVDAVLAGTAAPASGIGPPAVAGAPVAAFAARAGVGGTRARHRVRHLLLPALHGVQDAIGWISPAALNYVSERLGVPPAEAYGVATFYSLLSTTEQPPRVAHVCDDIACRGAGALDLCRRLEQRLGPAHHAGGPAKAAHYGAPGHGTGEDGTGVDRTAAGGAAGAAGAGASASARAAWITSPCLGLCEAAPAVLLQLAGEPGATLAPATAAAVCTALQRPAGAAADSAACRAAPGAAPAAAVSHGAEPVAGHAPSGGCTAGAAPGTPAALPAAGPASAAGPPALHSVPQAADPADAAELTLLRRVGRADPESLSDYRRHGGCSALRRAIELGPAGVLRELRDSRLQGRGGAAFPTAAKWEAVAGAAAHPHYVVCNADESEPGTFKDRVVMEQDPFAVIEALVIAGFTTGATTGYLYIRGEYPLATRRLLHAIAQARAWGLLGSDIMGLGVDFDVEVRRGAGAYICGEETALFNSLEGFRGEPRSKPPYPTEAGLFGKPTAVNNVETLINLLPIMLGGGRSYAAVGTEQSTGPKLFCLSGAVARPGVYEVEFGTTLRDLLALAGGTTGGQPRAILLGGAAGSFVGSEHLDLPLTFEDTRAAGTTLGSGVVMPFAPGTDFLDIVRRIAQFFRDESCGQCVPCRVGTVRQEEALQRWAGGGGAEHALLADLAQVMGDASICGLGHTAASALQSALRLGLLDRNGEG